MTELYANVSNLLKSGIKSLKLIVLLLLVAGSSKAGAPGPEGAIMQDQVNDPNVRTVLFHKSNFPNMYPIMQLSSDDKVTLKFDLVGKSGSANYMFTIVHCDADWTVSNMMRSDYIEGLYQDYVVSFSFSTATLKRYTHYRLEFPTAQMKPRISGNYILKVYTDDPDKPIIQRRFYVFDNEVTVLGDVHRASYPQYRENMQEVDFNINYNNLPLVDPFREIKVVVKQNWRSDNEITGLKPTYIQDKTLIYDYQEGNLFPGGNEFRPFDVRDFRYKGNGVRYFLKGDTGYTAVLFEDEDRSYHTYTYVPDNNGQYLISNKQGSDASTDADYCWATFKLDPSTYDEDREIYVYGALTDWKIDPRFKMQKDRYGKSMTCTAQVKQGYYDFQYAVVDKTGKMDLTSIEGSHWETENRYTIFVYYRPNFLTGDKLVGFFTMNSTVK